MPTVHASLLNLCVQSLRVKLQLRELQIGVEVVGLLLNLLSRLAQRRQSGRMTGQLLSRLSHTLWIKTVYE